MSVKKSIEHYQGINGRKKLNCAQSLIAGFSDDFTVEEKTIAAFASCGGGKAPEGRCGALHAAQYILGGAHTESAKKCEEIFTQSAGSVKCKEIRAQKKLPCPECVEKAAEFLEKCNANNRVGHK